MYFGSKQPDFRIFTHYYCFFNFLLFTHKAYAKKTKGTQGIFKKSQKG